MKRLLPLMQREWLQHRLGWALMATVPLALSLLLLSFGQIQIDSGDWDRAGAALPALMAAISIAGTTAVLFGIAWASSLIIVSGMARRDHADRSIEFWLSVPVSHTESLAAPLLVHLLIVPAVALVIGLLGGYVLSLVLVVRVAGFSAWLGLPWGAIATATLSWTLRLLAGLPLATLWLAPLILLVVLLTAYFRRWGWVILTVGLGLGGWLLRMVFGQPLISELTAQLLKNAGQALFLGRDGQLLTTGADGVADRLALVPGWALDGVAGALEGLASPLFVGALLFSAGCFSLLVQWRQRGAGGVG